MQKILACADIVDGLCTDCLRKPVRKTSPAQEEPNTTEEGSNLVGVAMPTKDLQRWNQDGET